jgi:chromosome segregation ATPase
MANPVCERLIRQILLCHERDDELLGFQRTLAQHAAQQEMAKEKIEHALQRLRKVEGIRDALVATLSASRQGYARAVEEDEMERKKLSDELQVRIDEVNRFANETNESHAKVLHENATCKEQIKILQQHRDSGDEKFKEIADARERELRNLKERLEHETAREPLLRDELERLEEEVKEARSTHDGLREEVSRYVAQFEAVQKRLEEAKKRFDVAKAEKEKMSRKIAHADNERQQALTRATKIRNEHSVETAKLLSIEKQVATVEQQTKKLHELLNSLTGNLQGNSQQHLDPEATQCPEA